MNSDETWLLYMWSGAFGAVISGVVAAMVAMLILRKTNQHQTQQADRALAFEKEKAAKELAYQQAQTAGAIVRERESAAQALMRQEVRDFNQREVQQAMAKRALDEQRAGLEQQLTEQRAESSKAREMAAIADMIAAVNGFISVAEDAFQMIPALQERALSAAFRWTMEQDGIKHLTGAMQHITLLGALACQAAEEAHDDPSVIAPSLLVLTGAASDFMTHWAIFPNADAETRKAHFLWLTDHSKVASFLRESP